MCPPPSQGTWQRRCSALPSGPSRLPAGSGSQQAEGGSQGAPSGLRHPAPRLRAVFSRCSAPAPRLRRPYLGRQPGRQRRAQAPSAGRRPPGLGGRPFRCRGRSSVWRGPGARGSGRAVGTPGSQGAAAAAGRGTSGLVSAVSSPEPASESVRARQQPAQPLPQHPQEAVGGTAAPQPPAGGATC